MTVVVIGGGPAGTSAAVHAARCGAEVVLVDAGSDLGGQLHRPQRIQHWKARVVELVEEVRAHPRIHHLAGREVRAVRGRAVHLRADSPAGVDESVCAEAVVLATGATERVLPFPGWDLPGVCTTGAAEAMASGQRIAVGGKVLVSGTGPSLLPATEALLDVGAEVLGVLEAGNAWSWLRSPTALGREALVGLVGYARRIAGRTRYRPRTAVIAARGRDRVREAVVARVDERWRPIPGSRESVAVDALCVGHGFQPRVELARAAGCRLVDGVVHVDAAQRTSVPRIYAAGELTGIAGAGPAMAEGALAGLAAAVQTRATTWKEVERTAERAMFDVLCGRKFACAGRGAPHRPRLAGVAHRGHVGVPLRGRRLPDHRRGRARARRPRPGFAAGARPGGPGRVPGQDLRAQRHRARRAAARPTPAARARRPRARRAQRRGRPGIMSGVPRIERTTELGPDLVRRVRDLLWWVFDDMTEHDWQHCLGGEHVLATDGERLVGFAALVPRLLLHGERPVRAGYVEGVAVAPTHRRRGVGGRIMAEVEDRIRSQYELGALGSSDEGLPFYRSRGWQVWRGRTFVRTPAGRLRTAEDEGAILIYPASFPLDLTADLTCQWRPGEPW